MEERVYESLFFCERTHIPASLLSPHPFGHDISRKYAHTYDLFVAVTAAVLSTSRLRVGRGICLITARGPITSAKEVASIDALSGAQLEFGVGPAGTEKRCPITAPTPVPNGGDDGARPGHEGHLGPRLKSGHVHAKVPGQRRSRAS